MNLFAMSTCAVLTLGLASVCSAADPVASKDAEEKIAEVAVNGIKGAELKPYRIMSAGLDAFDEYRRLAPAAKLQFRLSKRGEANEFNGHWDDVTMRLAGNDTSIQIPIAHDGTFILPRNQQAFDDDADLVLNQKKLLIRFSPDVRTPGIPANARRLGDYRLECQVIVGIGKKELNFAQRMAINTFMMGGDWCSRGAGKFGFSLPDKVVSATIFHDGKRLAVPASAYQVVPPIQDRSIPDDALIEFEFWSAASVERKKQFFSQWPVNLKTSANKWGSAFPLRLKENSRYSTEIPLKPGKWEFHLDSKGGEISLGTSHADTPVVPGVDHAVQWHWKNLTLNIEQAGLYELSLNVQDPDRPVVHVRRTDVAFSAP
ncbi:MAG: hypothetical protein V4631_22495 [Pseudomonadota bacterium]